MKIKKPKIVFGKAGFIFLAVFAVLLAADLITKACADAYIWQFTVIPGLIEVVPVRRNSGAAFSFLADTEWGQSFLVAVTVVMIVVLIAAFLFLPKKMQVMKVAVTLIISGAFGNLVDRCLYLGETLAERGVRDFVDVNMFGKWACCNFADFWIVFGVILAAVDLLFLNDWAAIPLTKHAKEAQRLREMQSKQDAAEQSEDGAEQSGETPTAAEGDLSESVGTAPAQDDKIHANEGE